MAGQHDVWTCVNLSALRDGLARRLRPTQPAHDSQPAHDAALDASGSAPRPRRGVSRRATAIVTVIALTTGVGAAVAVGEAHKSVTVDVDGELRTVSTFAGSVAGLLKAEGIVIGPHDDVVPAPERALGDGSDIVVRHADRVSVLVDGETQLVWTTALSASDALAALAMRGDKVSLVASRSGARADLPLDLTVSGPIDVRVDGETRTAQDGSLPIDEILAGLGVELAELDRVTVEHAKDGTPQLVVRRVVIEDVTKVTTIEHDSETEKDSSRYTDDRTVLTKGKDGKRTVVTTVTRIDGKVTEKFVVSDEVTKKPVTEVVRVGTKKREEKVGSDKRGPKDPDGLNWAALAKCESGGSPTVVSRNGLYHGLYQFSVATWRSVGGKGLPSKASSSEQLKRAKILYSRSGAGQWPHCGPRLFT